MKKGVVTVVLPIYNVEQYLDRCIDSVVKQTYTNLEILLIDDGSSDGCPQKCDEWARRDSRIRVIHKQNEGLGMARNTGIDNAKGEYILFFDSDDYIAIDTVESAYSLAVKETADIVIFGYNTIDANGNKVLQFVPCDVPATFFKSEVLDSFFPDFVAPNPYKRESRRFYMSSCLLMYSKELITRSNWRFVSERDIISEDVYSMLALFKNVEKVAVLPKALYYYCYNATSLTRSYKPNRYEKIKHFYLSSLDLCKRMQYSENIIRRVDEPYISFTIAAMKQECAIKRSFKEKITAIKVIVDDELLQNVLRKNKKDVDSFLRKILFFVIRNKWYFGIMCMVSLKG